MRNRIGYRFLELNTTNHSALLARPDMRLDAGGIAKGYAMDEAMKVLRSMDIRHAMIHGGGDMVFGERPPGRRGWRIQLTETNAPALYLSNCALATSGDLVQYLEIDGVRYSHIVDPHTGVGLTNRSLVNVIAPDGITADSLSTTLNILGPAESAALLRTFHHVEVRLTRVSDGNQVTINTPGFNSFSE